MNSSATFLIKGLDMIMPLATKFAPMTFWIRGPSPNLPHPHKQVFIACPPHPHSTQTEPLTWPACRSCPAG